ncbi:MAG TPA: cytochrome b5 domain-containing protein [Anaerolineae bacterium]|nr:cytochrome b5 domain-containing protein [Anaerolineae bacterium]
MSDLSSERTFTERELQKYDGTRGQPVYIAYDGVVYDVTAAPLWRTGQHQDLHFSGVDLTRSLRTPGGPPSQSDGHGQAPHGTEVFARPGVKPIGRLSGSELWRGTRPPAATDFDQT